MAPAKVEAIQKLPRPYNVPELQRVLGMSNFVQKFTLGLADHTRALRELLKKDNQWTWGDAQECAFAQLKKQLSSPPGKRGGGGSRWGIIWCLVGGRLHGFGNASERGWNIRWGRFDRS